MILRESIPRKVNKKSEGPQGERGLEFSRRRKGQTFFILFHFLNLQYCIGLAIYQNESATGIHVFPVLNPPPSPYHPSGLFQCTSPKHPVSCIKPGLATHFTYDIIHVSMPFSQIIPPSPSLIFWKRSLVFPILLFSSISLH